MEATAGMIFSAAGFCSMNQTKVDMRAVIERVGQVASFDDPGFNIKLYPCCSSSHTAIDGLIEGMAEAKVNAADIDNIEVSIGPDVPAILMFDIPKSPLEGKFSIRYPLAVAWQTRQVTLDDFTQARIDDPILKPLMSRIRVTIDEKLPRSPNGVTHASRVTINLKNGKSASRLTEHPRGSAARPLSDTTLAEKFCRCAEPSLGTQARAVFDALIGMHKNVSVSALLNSVVIRQ
jgi:2-methylcitrate dehydratase PrpD